MKKLREYMYEKKLTMKKLASLIGCSERTICYILSGSNPSKRMQYIIDKLISKK